MTEDEKKRRLSKRPRAQAYEVGHGKPPVHSRFKTGKSGNPRGRPKGSRNKGALPALNEERMKSIIMQEAYRTVTVNDAKGAVTIPMAQAIMRALAVNAAKGLQRSQRLFTELLIMTEKENKRLHDEWMDVAITYKVEWERELERRKRLGIEAPPPLPHPDHVVIDMRANTAHIRGPATKEEKAEWDMWMDRRQMFEEELAELIELNNDPDYPHKDIVREEIERTEKVLKIIRDVVG
jgi:hypothetical protein